MSLNQRNMSNRRTPNGNHSAYDRRIEETNRNLMESDNDAQWKDLDERVSMLKSVSTTGDTLASTMFMSVRICCFLWPSCGAMDESMNTHM
jgi:hypothetical protein